jgi:hypothetical protein
VVVTELRGTSGFSAPPLVAEELFATNIEESTSVEVLTPELQLAIAYELLHNFDMAEKNMSLSMEELDLIEFLVAQVVLLSSSLAVEVTCEAVVAESLTRPSVVIDL